MALLSAVAEPTRTDTVRLLVIGPSDDLPEVIERLGRSHAVEFLPAESPRAARDPQLLERVDAAVYCQAEDSSPSDGDLQLLADALLSHRIKCVVLSSGTTGGVPRDNDAFVYVPAGISPDELWGRVAMIKQYVPHLRRMEAHVSTMQRLGKRLNRHFVEVDQELRLATRLQRDFLPKTFPEVGQVRFAALYRPASWVSGDVYDVRRLDESHVALYLADAVGHGVAAGLLTMFIRQSVIGKRVDSEAYELIPPDQVLARLNRDLADQNLPNSQFVTACYALINVVTHEISFARGGHPHPIHVTASGACSEVRTDGGLLGVFPDEAFPTTSLVLEPGEKFIIYSDGLENDIFTKNNMMRDQAQLSPHFIEMARLPAPDFLATLGGKLDQAVGSLEPADDISCVVVERLK